MPRPAGLSRHSPHAAPGTWRTCPPGQRALERHIPAAYTIPPHGEAPTPEATPLLRYRPQHSAMQGTGRPAALTPDAPRAVLADALLPAHFFTGPHTTLEWVHVPAEETAWEIFQGRLLDRAHTRRRRTFEAWNVHLREGD